MKNIELEYYGGEIIIKNSHENDWQIRREMFGFSLEHDDFDVIITCSIIGYVENTHNTFVSMVCKQGKLPIRMTSFRSNSNEIMKDINDGIQDVLKVPKDLLLEFLLKGRFRTSELIEMLEFDKRFKTYDYALPQNWLDEFSKYIEVYDNRITYHLIISTTVWCYTENSLFGKGVSVCTEVNRAIERYNSNRVDSRRLA